MYSQISLILAAIVVVSVCVSDEELLKQHKLANRQLPCGPPQPRVFALKDILEEDQHPGPCETILPGVSVLHVCDFSSGCCEGSNSCQPVKVEEVTLVFQILKLHSRNKSSPCFNEIGRKRYMRVTATNHTMCACRRKLELDTPK